jgi:hypothetical protein
LAAFLALDRKSKASSGSCPRASRTALSAVRMNRLFFTPGTSGGDWKDRNSPARARSRRRQQVLAAKQRLPPCTR